MHIKGYVITKNKPTLNEIYDMLEPYYYDNDTEYIGWDWFEIGGRYSGAIQIKSSTPYNHIIKKENNNSIISKITRLFERNNDLDVDSAYYEDIVDFDITKSFIVFDNESKTLYVRERWNGISYKTDDTFDEKVKNINLEGKIITIIDFHV